MAEDTTLSTNFYHLRSVVELDETLEHRVKNITEKYGRIIKGFSDEELGQLITEITVRDNDVYVVYKINISDDNAINLIRDSLEKVNKLTVDTLKQLVATIDLENDNEQTDNKDNA